MELPDEVLADVLHRVLQPQHLAACRRVCANWRRVIDGHKLLLPHLLPGASRGLFINYTADDGWSDVGYLSRGILDGSIDTRLCFTPPWNTVIDHCNGLLLCASEETCFVYNPVTRPSAQLPAPPGAEKANWGIGSAVYLVFDPAVSLHYEVFWFPYKLPEKPAPPVPTKPSPPPPFNVGRLFMAGGVDEMLLPGVETDDDDGEDWLVDSEENETHSHYSSIYHEYGEAKDTMGLMEWPPPVYVIQVFSSLTGRWEEKTFARKGDAVGTVADMWLDSPSHMEKGAYGPHRRYIVYFRKFLYIQCHGGFVMRLSLPRGTYLVIQSPRIVSEYNRWSTLTTYLGKSEKGIYYTATDYLTLRVWVLNEETEPSHGTLPVWEMVHHADLEPPLSQQSDENREEKDRSWILDHEKAIQTNQGYREWDSDDDSGDDTVVSYLIEAQYDDDYDDDDDFDYDNYEPKNSLYFLGYHPDKEIILLGCRMVGDGCAYAYYLGTLKLEYLGGLYPQRGTWITFWPRVRESYVYAPCRIDLLPDENGTSTDLSYWL